MSEFFVDDMGDRYEIIETLVPGGAGQWLPQEFAEQHTPDEWHIDRLILWQDLLDGPYKDRFQYWDSFATVMDSAWKTVDGKHVTLMEDSGGNLLAVVYMGNVRYDEENEQL